MLVLFKSRSSIVKEFCTCIDTQMMKSQITWVGLFVAICGKSGFTKCALMSLMLCLKGKMNAGFVQTASVDSKLISF